MKKDAHPKQSSTNEWVQIATLTVDMRAQRSLNRGWVNKHIDTFDVDMLGRIVVNVRTDGTVVVVDGQHRVALLRAVGWGDQKIEAEVFHGLSLKEEAALFLARNDARAVTTYAKFMAGFTAGESDKVDIVRIVQKAGLVISERVQQGNIVAVRPLMAIYHGDGIADQTIGVKALEETLEIMVQAWGRSEGSLVSEVIHGIGLVCLRYGKTVNKAELMRKLRGFPGGVPTLVGKARTVREMYGRKLSHSVATVIVDLYNKGRHKDKLEPWEPSALNDRPPERRRSAGRGKATQRDADKHAE